MNETWSQEQQTRLDELAATTDESFVLELLDDFERDGGSYAREIAASVENGDLDSLRIAAHSLKSMGFSLGFGRLGAACERIESATRQGTAAGQPFTAELEAIRADLDRSSSVRRRWLEDRA